MDTPTQALPQTSEHPTVEGNCPSCGARLLWRGHKEVAGQATEDWAWTQYSLVVECTAKECDCAITEIDWSDLSDKAAQQLRPRLPFVFEVRP